MNKEYLVSMNLERVDKHYEIKGDKKEVGPSDDRL